MASEAPKRKPGRPRKIDVAPPPPNPNIGLLNSLFIGAARRRNNDRDPETGKFRPGHSSPLARLGGHRSGKALAARMTPEQRQARARKAALAMHAKRTPEQHREISRIGGMSSQAARPPDVRAEMAARGAIALNRILTREQKQEISRKAGLRSGEVRKKVANG